MWSTVLAVTLSIGLPVAAAEVTNNGNEGAPSVPPLQTGSGGSASRRGDVVSVAEQTVEVATLESSFRKTWGGKKTGRDGFNTAMVSNGGNPAPGPITEQAGYGESDPLAEPPIEHTSVNTGAERLIRERAADDATKSQVATFDFAQFQVPKGTREGTGPSQREAREILLPAALRFQYAYGSDSEITYLKNPDLNNHVRDDSIIAAPTFFTLMTYRPNAWLETTLEMTIERLISLQQEPVITLPDGSLQYPEKRRFSLLVDQLYVMFKELGPFDFTVGRRNFEDGRLWLYDAALDAIIVKHKQGNFHTEASVSRENFFDGELLFNVPKGTINNYILYTEYRGIEDHKLAAYAIKRYDRVGKEGRPLHMGVRAYGRPADSYNYWAELGYTRGHDEFSQKLSGHAFDVGATYRFLDHPLQPTVTLGYAYGSGDDNRDDNTNREFRQTGLQSNEGRYGGVTQFKRYGEMFDPELSNIRIFTAGVSCRPAANAWVDLVYLRYRLDEYATELRSSGITALMNQDVTHLSRDVGSEIDLILGFRNLFGFRRFGFEARFGWFFPGDAYRIPEGDPLNPTYRKADKGVSMLFVLIL